MPYGKHDRYGYALKEYHQVSVLTIVLLASYDECMLKARRDLSQLYTQKGYKVIYFPIDDFGIPQSVEELDRTINEVLERVRANENIAIHCSAGIGRTGLFVACLATKVLNCDGDRAMEWVRKFIPDAVEMPEQEDFVCKYARYRDNA
jgi:protein-tyrosine phosphatase